MRLGEGDLKLDGNGVPDSRRGTINKRAVGKSKIRESIPGEFAKSVIERRSGATNSSHSAGNIKDFEGGKRDLRAEYKAIEDRATADMMFMWVMDEPVIPETKASFEAL